MTYFKKYIKYKTKYLTLKGGVITKINPKESYFYNYIEYLISTYKTELLTLSKFENLNQDSTILDFISLMDIKFDDIESSNIRVISVEEDELLFSSQSEINRKTEIVESSIIDKNRLMEFTENFYQLQSFTDINSLHISLHSSYLGMNDENFGRIFCYKVTKKLNLLDFSESVEKRNEISVFLTKKILGDDYTNFICKDKTTDRRICCYKVSCDVYTLNEYVINFFLERYEENSIDPIDGIKRVDYQEAEPTEKGYELFLFNKNNLTLSAIFLKNTLFFKKEDYDKYLENYLSIINNNIRNKKLTYNNINKKEITDIIQDNITNIKTNESFYS